MFKALMTSAALFLLAVAAHAGDARDAAVVPPPDATHQDAKDAPAAPPPDLTHQDVDVSASRPAEAVPEFSCHQEAQTGSSILHKVCRKKDLTPAEQEAVRQARQRINDEAGVAAQQWIADKFKIVNRNN